MLCVLALVTAAVCFSYARLQAGKQRMRCFVLPATCNVDSALYRACAGLEAAILAPILRPAFAQSELGDFGLGVLARGIAATDRHGFAAALAAQLERAS